MWYGLKEEGKLVAVKSFDYSPTMFDFGVPILPKYRYCVVVVRVREVSVT